MAASMIIAGRGSITKVRGRRMPIAAADPSPGSTPTSVPRKQPIKANSRLGGCIAVGKPPIRNSRLSMIRSKSDVQEPDRQRYAQELHEHLVDTEAAHQGD